MFNFLEAQDSKRISISLWVGLIHAVQKQFGDAGGCWIYLPNEKIVGLEGKELSILLSVFLPVFTRFWSQDCIIWRNSLHSFLILGGGNATGRPIAAPSI